MSKTIVYVDMDDTLCDYKKAHMASRQSEPSIAYPQSIEGFFLSLKPLPNAIETFRWLFELPELDVYILTAPSVYNPHSYTEKRRWVERYFDLEIAHRLIISPVKGLSKGDYLIDDLVAGKGQEDFVGKIMQYGSEAFPDWLSIRAYFEANYYRPFI